MVEWGGLVRLGESDESALLSESAEAEKTVMAI